MFCKLKAVLIDLSGTIHIESNEIVGSIDALTRLRRSGLRYKFVTNTTKESQNFLYERLKSIGFDIEKNEIFTSLVAARDFIRNEKLWPHLLLEECAMEDFQDVTKELVDSHKGEAVVVGLAPSKFNYDTLNDSFDKLLNGARLVAIHQGRYYKTTKGLALGPGPFVKALAYGADIKPEDVKVVGKPDRNFFLSALQSLNANIQPDEAVMIGDDVRDDIAGAMALGMQGILVRTGKYRPDDENKINPSPTLTVATFAEAIETILSDLCN
ncbi:haloacid dehalogenase-like hydrolase domain-containing protein 2 [Dermatophagoides farinae]|uniref:Haloacid dehalogenase-like hydrolase domain-containing protein 2 n=1 Tax=Dermatophagoides farinae TaxID=6954 RepID=A0A922ID65_DERFA|nr:haloacid dehalogenase-like hydrolase domain-containing protein 2 [Dermatophagoides farinae]KAH7641896.1 haloacid dehalogenase-like protein hydrolase domain-containing protein [Dermatophagoides farinae]KAH9528950.1 Haloacid dehalogenase-like hydrolase domain-containing protein 2 [Dermatophagoides farinae]